MAIEFNCAQCGKLLRTADEKAGLQARCPGCGAEVTVPDRPAQEIVDWGGDANSVQPPSEVPDASPMKSCPVCGQRIRAAAIKCRYCGEDLSGTAGLAAAGFLRPHRGGLILTFGILTLLGCFFFVFGPLAWVMGNRDLREMEEGRMDPSGESLTRAGKILAIIGVCLYGLLILAWCGMAILAMAAGGFN